MRKITNFIVDKRYYILVLFIIFTIISAIFSSKVKINYDIAEYLPDTSETRKGMDIMEEEFAGTETSNLNLMFEELPKKEKQEVKEDLEKIEGIKKVEYDDSKNYNKDNYTLYVITVDDDADSELASKVYDKVTEKYENYKIYTSGDVSDTNKVVLPFKIIALAVGCALVILIIMCESYIEPFLFLTAILMAVLLNKGTNIIFGTVSNITNSISAILQLALSMDYSIMLMNRYAQEKETENDKVKAMKNALYNAFQAISSSSITTIVGLLVLIFMSFTIGRDLGLVLAKGVLFSLISIFFVLPALILIFDKLITKTKKKSPNIKLDILGKFSYKIRFIAIPLFLIIFIASFMLKGNLGIDYTETQSDEISDVFEENNQMVVLYKNSEEEKIAKYVEKLKKDKKVDDVLSYKNTIAEKLTYDKLNERLDDLGADVNIDDYLLKIIYYDYFVPEENTKLDFGEFVKFIEEDAYNNEEVSKQIDEETRNNITRLKNFISVEAMNQKRPLSEISTILEIDEEQMNNMITLYLSKNYSGGLGNIEQAKQNITFSLKEFVDFLLTDVASNPAFAGSIAPEKALKLTTINMVMNNVLTGVKYTSSEMFDISSKLSDTVEENMIKTLYIYYDSSKLYDETWTITVEEFVEFLNENILNDERFNDFIEDDMRNDIIKAKTDIKDAKDMLLGDKYSRILLNTKYAPENKETFNFVQKVKDMLGKDIKGFYIVGDSPMAYEMSQTFGNELNFMTIITMVAIFIVVAITFKSVIIPIMLVLTIQCAVYLTMGIVSFVGENVYFIAILIVQSILMGATIDYAILYTSYYLENRRKFDIKESIIQSYNSSIHTILTSSSILIIVTLIIANFASAIAAKICKTISQGTLCSTILILTLLPAILAMCDKIIIKQKKSK